MRFGRRHTGEKPPGPQPSDATILGRWAFWGRVGYTGAAFTPADRTYLVVDPCRVGYSTIMDSGRYPRRSGDLANLTPLIAAALYEVGFTAELGPLATWRN